MTTYSWSYISYQSLPTDSEEDYSESESSEDDLYDIIPDSKYSINSSPKDIVKKIKKKKWYKKSKFIFSTKKSTIKIDDHKSINFFI